MSSECKHRGEVLNTYLNHFLTVSYSCLVNRFGTVSYFNYSRFRRFLVILFFTKNTFFLQIVLYNTSMFLHSEAQWMTRAGVFLELLGPSYYNLMSYLPKSHN